MKYPKKLEKGDTVGLICTSSDVETARIQQCVDAVEAMGYKVKTADNLDVCYAGYMAGTGKVRGEWVNKMFADPEVKGIFCVRGGDGSSRIMEHLDYELIKNNPKIFVGYSDVTNLHLELDTKGKILFIEEVCEPITKVEKWLYHLRNAGKLKDACGIILGQFTKIVNEDMPEYDEIACAKDIFEGLDIPVMYNIQSGHGKQMMTIPMGAVCEMNTADKSIVFKIEQDL